MVTLSYLPHPASRASEAMSTEIEDDMRTALRQARAIAAVSGQSSMRRILGLAHQIYTALILLEPGDRVRRIRLTDAIFGCAARDSEHRHGDL